MKIGFYLKLAWTGIKKNKQIYLPYIITCVGMVMMYYIISFLRYSDTLQSIPGGGTAQSMMGTGTGVIGVFAAIFLFYTNSFLIRRRKKEFGLYNILGMGKGNLVKIQVCETGMVLGITIISGLFFGILFSKIAELMLINIMGGKINFQFTVAVESVRDTVLLFVIVFAVIFLRSVSQIGISNPIELLHSETVGEKRPRANWFLALAGVVVLAVAYYMAITIKNPITAIAMFFVAVALVVVGTYLLFLAGSVALCRLLQMKKNFYYQTSHFVSVGSMTYRMRRNGAGLASICVLSTMVLVMISSSTCLYAGAENSLRTRYPRNMVLNIYSEDDGEIQKFHDIVEGILEEENTEPKNILEYNMISLAAFFSDGKVVTALDDAERYSMSNYEKIIDVFVIPLEDYNRMMGETETLSSGEALVYMSNNEVYESLDIDVYGKITVKKMVDNFIENGNAVASIVPSLYLITSEYDKVLEKLKVLNDSGNEEYIRSAYSYGFDLDISQQKQIDLYRQIRKVLNQYEEEGLPTVNMESVAMDRDDFYGIYGGLFFLGILLGIVFVTATVLIMYYKQISEGYEDQARFEIMQKVGMTKQEIKRSVNSQVLMVFFAPLAMAGVHLGFSFPIIARLLLLFGLDNKLLFIGTMAGCYLVFGLLYVIVYHITSRAYYRLISGRHGWEEMAVR